jgi:hypothetical protein
MNRSFDGVPGKKDIYRVRRDDNHFEASLSGSIHICNITLVADVWINRYFLCLLISLCSYLIKFIIYFTVLIHLLLIADTIRIKSGINPFRLMRCIFEAPAGEYCQ